jgi:hypothetical protein
MEQDFREASNKLMTDWFRRVRQSQHIHYACGSYFSRLNLYLGIPTIALSSVVGTAVFASLDKQNIGNYKILVGMVSILAALLASLQTFLGFSERAEKHRVTSAGYAAVRRRIEMLKTFPPNEKEQMERALAEIKNEMDALADSSPEVPRRIGNRVLAQLKSKEHVRLFHLSSEEDKLA